ncbi:IS630 family transposase [Streptomyces asoensis]|uniref:IS630 family transposase n=1 Tax=Streptomyces asoensis TaxID=249586 RepID=A0A6M4WTM9_9ACTN|nr:transposase [Streptomyces asoensis]QJS99682.1 IS630 family transposase [Streptomyces asoensis]
MGGGRTTRAACGGWICFEDEVGFTRRPPTGRTWGRRGITPGRESERPRLRAGLGRRADRDASGLADPAVPPAATPHRTQGRAPQLVRARLRRPRRRRAPTGQGAPIVLVWDRLNTHISHKMRDLIDARSWLTVFTLPAYAPELNAVEYLWAHVKHSLANLAGVALDRLAALVRNRLKRLQYRPDVLDGFLAGTGLAIDLPPSSP